MTESIAVSPQLLAIMARKSVADPWLISGYMSGQIATLAARPAHSVKAIPSRFKSRQHPRSPDRLASRNRRRTLGGSSALPNPLRCYYTEGQRAVLTVMAGEVSRKGYCDLPIDKIGALAGVCRTTVQTTIHEARVLGHISVRERPRTGQRSLTNVIRIISPEWLTWLSRSGKAASRWTGSKSSNLVSPTKREDNSKYASGIATASPQGRAPPKSDLHKRWDLEPR